MRDDERILNLLLYLNVEQVGAAIQSLRYRIAHTVRLEVCSRGRIVCTIQAIAPVSIIHVGCCIGFLAITS